MKTFYRQSHLAQRYRVKVRTIDRMRRDGRLPQPDFYLGASPLWSDETIEANEREAAKRTAASSQSSPAPESEGDRTNSA